MELMTEKKKGFKRTEVGVIPEDWTIVPLDTLVSYTNGKAHEQSIDEAGQYIVVNSKFISTEGKVKKFTGENNCPAKVDDILMVMSDVPNGRAIAKCFYVDQNDKYSVNQRICLLNAQNVDSRLLFYILNRNKYYLAFDDGVKQTNLRKDDVLNCPIPLPPTLEEQQAIASALSDVDELIRSLDGLIQKKQAIKKGTMQQLLTGKNRLPGFDGEWEVMKLGDVTSLITKGTTPTSLGKAYTDRGISFIKAESIDKAGDVIKDKTAFIDEETNYLLKRSILQKNDIMFSIAGVLGRTAIIKEEYLPANTNQALAIIRLSNDTDISYQYLFHFLRTEQIEKHIQDINVQAAQANLSLKDVSEFQIEVPPTFEEQEQIVQIMSDMDRELQTLRQKREKYVQIKQGMMQELLTGRVRLV